MAVAAFHVALVGALLSVRTLLGFRPETRDTVTWIIVPPVQVPPAPTSIPQPRVLGSLLPPLSAPVITLPALPNPIFPSRAPGNAITLPNATPTLSLQLFDRDLRCSLERYDSLEREEAIHCTDILAGLNSPEQYALTMDEENLHARWEREYARKKAPFLVPCIGPGGLADFITLIKCVADVATIG